MTGVESNGAPGTFNQLRIALVHGLTYKLFCLYYQIEAIRSELEVRCTTFLFTMQSMMVPQLKVNKQQLDTETVTGAKVPRSVCGKCVLIYSWMLLTSDDSLMVSSATAPPVNDHVDEPTLLLLAATVMP